VNHRLNVDAFLWTLNFWNHQITKKKMNQGKVGAPFEYSHSYIHFQAFLKIGFKIAYKRTILLRQDWRNAFYTYQKKDIKGRPSVRNLDSKVEEEPDKPVVSFRITKGNIHDTKKFGQLMKESAGRYSMIKYMVTSHTTTEGRTSIY
jgi:hypothetical protein